MARDRLLPKGLLNVYTCMSVHVIQSSITANSSSKYRYTRTAKVNSRAAPVVYYTQNYCNPFSGQFVFPEPFTRRPTSRIHHHHVTNDPKNKQPRRPRGRSLGTYRCVFLCMCVSVCVHNPFNIWNSCCARSLRDSIRAIYIYICIYI